MMAAGASRVAPIPPPRLMEVSRIIIDPVTHKAKPAVVKPPPKPIVKVPVHHDPPKPIIQPKQKSAPPPPPQRNKVITAPAKSGPATDPNAFTAPPDGNRAAGKPGTQDQGDIKPNPPAAVKQPDPIKQPDPVKQPAPVVKQPDPVKQPPPVVKQPDPPKPKGPTVDSEPTGQVQPEIPDDLKTEDLKTFVRVRVEIAEDGSFQVVLRTSSGKKEVDDLILNALKKWKWKPALKEGEPIKSTQLFKFEIEVK